MRRNKHRNTRTAAAFAAAAACICTLAACGQNQTHPDPPDPYQPGDAGTLACVPNLDGRIDANELQTAIGVPVSFLVSPAGKTRTVDLVGAVDQNGQRVWDWSQLATDDQAAELQAQPLTGTWFADSFPDGQFTLALDPAGQTLGVYRRDPQSGLYLLGVASKEPEPVGQKALLVYQTPILITKFPVVAGDAWTSSGTVQNGILLGLPYSGTDTYEIKIDGTGRLKLPDLEFTQVFRMRTKVTVAPAIGAPIVRRQTLFLFECFAEVARAQSQNGETNENFTTAAEVRRLAL